ncbi:SCO3933 family regulatory protein [Streptomyces sp. NBC_00448]|uniref:SCO3933 family regulatory protein n=1 Tax=Streptomyces sp. NBC_00448 TaxID=2903652 RepID=UPI002E242385
MGQLQSIPVDTSRLGMILCVVGPEPRVNPETGQVRQDRDGNTIFVVGVVVRQVEGRRAETIEVAVPGEPRGIVEGMPVRIENLTAIQWTMGARSGTSFRATAITAGPVPQGPAVAASAGAGRGKSGAAGES